MTGTVVILIYRRDLDVADFWSGERTPFSGIEVVAVEAATPGSDYEDIIGPLREENPGSKFHIEEV